MALLQGRTAGGIEPRMDADVRECIFLDADTSGLVPDTRPHFGFGNADCGFRIAAVEEGSQRRLQAGAAIVDYELRIWRYPGSRLFSHVLKLRQSAVRRL